MTAAERPRAGSGAVAARSRFSALRAFSAMDGLSARRTGVAGLSLFLMPILVMAVVGSALGSYLDPAIRVGVFDRADTPASRALVAALRAAPDLAVPVYTDEARLRAGVHRGRLASGLVLPAGWDGSAPVVFFASDASDTAPLVRAVLESVLADVSSASSAVRGGSRARAEIAVDSAVASGGPTPRLLGFRYAAPANLVMFALIAGCTAASRLVLLRRMGIGPRLAAVPAGRIELVAGLAIGPLQLIAAQAVFLLAAGRLAFGVDWGPPLAVAALTAGLVAAAASIALFLGTVYRSVEQAVALGPFLGMALGMLGGCWWPLEVAPAPLRAVAKFLPSTWAMEGYLDLVARGGGGAEVAPRAAALFTLAAVLFALAARRLRWQLAR
jgi:ABC-2 type transport system permease protein